MNIFKISLKNIRRKFLRTSIILFIFSLGIVSVVSLYKVSKVVSASFEEKLNKFGANIILNPKSEAINISYGGINLGNVLYDVKYIDLSATINKINRIKYRKNISTIAPKLIVIKDIFKRKVGLVGVKFEEEIKIKNYWSINGFVPKKSNHILLGSEIAKNLNLKLGNRIDIEGESFEVSGIISKVGSEEDYLIFLDIFKLQRLLSLHDKASFIEISALCAGCPIEEIVSEIEKILPDFNINALQKVVKQRMAAIHFVENLAYMISGIILITTSFVIGLFIFNAVNERKKEIGILRSMGYSKFSVFVIFSFEGFIIALISGVLGYIVGVINGNFVLDYLHIENAKLYFDLIELFYTVIGVLILTSIASLYPSYRASKIEPIDTIASL